MELTPLGIVVLALSLVAFVVGLVIARRRRKLERMMKHRAELDQLSGLTGLPEPPANPRTTEPPGGSAP